LIIDGVGVHLRHTKKKQQPSIDSNIQVFTFFNTYTPLLRQDQKSGFVPKLEVPNSLAGTSSVSMARQGGSDSKYPADGI
jgi:hypothetical protein